jgi:hypothetical protein
MHEKRKNIGRHVCRISEICWHTRCEVYRDADQIEQAPSPARSPPSTAQIFRSGEFIPKRSKFLELLDEME